VNLWVQGARPRTLTVSVVPVVVGTAAAHHVDPLRTALLLVVALGLQVGVNYANDYYDGVRGVDTAERRGPVRLTASGLKAPRAVLSAALVSFFVAAIAGGVLALMTSWWLLGVGVLAVLAALGYSGGPAPYGARAMGELFVFVFFGLVAVVGSAYVQIERIPARAWWVAVPVGLLAVAVLVANNLRDIPTDAASEKRTLAVRLGDTNTRGLYRVLVTLSFAAVIAGVFGPLPGTAFLVFASAPLAARALHRARVGRTPQELVGLLVITVRMHLLFGIVLSIGLVWT
jgi:1,4-dihydroxy-2-naphthoate octaprenyltransferase